MDAEAAADDIDISDFRDWGDPERIAVNVATLYREFDPSLAELAVPRAVHPHGALERAARAIAEVVPANRDYLVDHDLPESRSISPQLAAVRCRRLPVISASRMTLTWPGENRRRAVPLR